LKTVIAGWTYFECTNTGTRSYYKPTRIPYVDDADQQIQNEEDWIHSRNQQRNWETILQCLSLRCQPMNIVSSVKIHRDDQDIWTFLQLYSSVSLFLKITRKRARLREVQFTA